MKRLFVFLATVIAFSATFIEHSCAQRLVEGGKTSILLSSDTLSLVGLTITQVIGGVSSDLGDGSVAFAINPRNGNLPTTFSYTAGSLAPFSGTFEHSGSIIFDVDGDPDPVQVGNLTIGYDNDRAGGDLSGFFVTSTVGIEEILFDLENPSNVEAQLDSLSINANLLISFELAALLGNSALTGVFAGNALVNATAIPEPSNMLLFSGILGGLVLRRRRRFNF